MSWGAGGCDRARRAADRVHDGDGRPVREKVASRSPADPIEMTCDTIDISNGGLGVDESEQPTLPLLGVAHRRDCDRAVHECIGRIPRSAPQSSDPQSLRPVSATNAAGCWPLRPRSPGGGAHAAVGSRNSKKRRAGTGSRHRSRAPQGTSTAPIACSHRGRNANLGSARETGIHPSHASSAPDYPAGLSHAWAHSAVSGSAPQHERCRRKLGHLVLPAGGFGCQ